MNRTLVSWAAAALTCSLWLAGCSVVLDPGGFTGGSELDAGQPPDAATPPTDGRAPDAPMADGGPDAGCTMCGGGCVDLDTDPAHCGGCGRACAPFAGCAGGICTTSQLLTVRGTETESVRGVATSPDGRVCVTGEIGVAPSVFRDEMELATVAGAASTDAFVACFAANGSLAWADRITGAGAAVGRGITIAGSDVVVVGYYDGTISFGGGGTSLPLASGTDGFVIRYAGATGAVLAGDRYGGTGDDEILSVASRDGRFCFGGNFRNTIRLPSGGGTTDLVSQGGADGFITCRDSPTAAVSRSFGSAAFDSINAVAMTDSSVVIGGLFSGTIASLGGITPLGAPDAFVAWLDATLTPTAQRRIGGSGTDFVQTLAAGPGGGVIVVGGCGGAGAIPTATPLDCPAGVDGFIAAYGPAPALQWGRVLSGPGFDAVLAAVVDPSGRIWVGGQFDGSLTVGTTTVSAPGAGDDGFFAAFAADGTPGPIVAWGGRDGDRILGAAWDEVRGAPVFCGEYETMSRVLGVDVLGRGGYDGLVIRLPSPRAAP